MKKIIQKLCSYRKVMLLYAVILAVAGIFCFTTNPRVEFLHIDQLTLSNEGEPYVLQSYEVSPKIDYSISLRAYTDSTQAGLTLDLYGGADFDSAENDFAVPLDNSEVQCDFTGYETDQPVYIRLIQTGSGTVTVSGMKFFKESQVSRLAKVAGGISFGIAVALLGFYVLAGKPKEISVKEKGRRIVFIDFLRCIAALSVILSHLLIFNTGGTYVIFPWIIDNTGGGYSYPLKNIFTPFLRVMTEANMNFGSLGVSLFFVMTGFTAMISLGRQEKIGAGSFALKKILRLYPTYIGGFAVSCAAAAIYAFTHGTEFPWTVKNMFIQISLFGRLIGVASLDGLVWTLECQMLFYIAVFAMYKAGLLKSPVGVFAGALVLFLAHFTIMGFLKTAFWINLADMILYVMFMLAGCALYQFYSGKWNASEALCCAGTVVMLYCGAVNNEIFSRSYFAGTVIFCLLMFADKGGRLLMGEIPEFFSKISFSLYASHSIVMYTGLAVLSEHSVNPLSASLIIFAVNTAVALAVYEIAEKPMNRLISRLAAKAAG